MKNYRVTITDTDKLRYVWYSTADNESEALAQLMPEILACEIPLSSIKVTAMDIDIEAISQELSVKVNA